MAEYVLAEFPSRGLPPVIYAPPMRPSIHLQSSDRELWQQRMRTFSAFINTGYLHVTLAAISLFFLVTPILIQIIIRRVFHIEKPNLGKPKWMDSKPSIPVGYEAISQALRIATLGLAVTLTVQHHGSWFKTSWFGYIFVLGIVRYLFSNHSSYRSSFLHHANVVLTIATILEGLEVLAPLAILGTTARPTNIGISEFAVLAAAVIVSYNTPRPKRSVTDLDLSPEETCSYFSYYMSYGWMTYIILRGCRKDLEIHHLPPLPHYDYPIRWLRKIQASRSKGGRTFATLVRLLAAEIRMMMLWASLYSMSEYIAPFAMFRLLGYIEDPGNAIVNPALWIILLFIGPMSRSIFYQQYLFSSTRLIVRLNMSLVQDIYQTALHSLSYDDVTPDKNPAAGNNDKDDSNKKKEKAQRQMNISTLMSTDVEAIYNCRDTVLAVTSVTISTTLAMIFLYRMLGWPSLLGIAVMLILFPLPTYMSRRLSLVQRTIMQATDQRIARITEYLGSIRTIKYFGWEDSMGEKVNAIRAVEQKRIWKRSLYLVMVFMCSDLLPLVTLLVMFSSFVLLTHQQLTAPIAFTALSIVETLRQQFFLLSGIGRWIAQGSESFRRLDHFFESAVKIKRHPIGPPTFKKATFRRTPVADFYLRDISVEFREKALNVITGPTGSGKTSLLLSLLGETVLESGEATCPEDVGYVAQTAWLQAASIRDNILFHSDFDESRYNAMIDAAGLKQDIEQFPDGDLTEIGEKGATLSGGQRQRIALARALYSASPVLILDDVFSALDTHTTTAVYDKCFRKGLLKDRTVILVTQLPSALQDADLLVTLENGSITSVQTREAPRTGLACETSQEQHYQPIETPEDHPTERAPPGPVRQRIKEEVRARGRVPRTLFFQYMLQFGGWPYAIFAILSSLTVQTCFFGITLWLSVWTGAYTDNPSPNIAFYLGIYAAFSFCFLLLQAGNTIVYQYGGWSAARRLHTAVVHAILAAPIGWFDENPIGRAINRFGKDMASLDQLLVEWLRVSFDNGIRFVLRIGGIASIMPVFALPAAIMCSIGFAVGEMYTRAQISIKRLNSISYSPVFSHFTDTMAGLSTIRARYGFDELFQQLLASRLATQARVAEAQYNSNRWVCVRSDFCAATVALLAGGVAYAKSSSVSAGLVGFSLTNAIGLSQTILMFVRTLNELEIELNSYQRMQEYTAIEPEEKPEALKAAVKVPAAWPAKGKVEFRDVTARYGEDGPDVLRNLSLDIEPGERVAVVGRTGSGKSTLGLTLLQFTNVVKGQILVDNIDVSKIHLKDLRRNITVIPQEPVLFAGDVRLNLDPLEEVGDAELEGALSACTSISALASHGSATTSGSTTPSLGASNGELTNLDDVSDAPTAVTRSKVTLSTPVATNGENFSHGQRQILSLARALARRSKVILLDEATASVDYKTDVKIQELLRDEFAGSTIVAIAHRLRTVIDYDKIVVLGGGELLEMGKPSELISKKGTFYQMLQNSGEFEELVGMVKS